MMSRLAFLARLRIFLPVAFCLVFGFADPRHAAAQAAQPDPIDRALDDCLNAPAANTTVGQVDCTAAAYKAWDKELNAVYKKLMKLLDPASAELLKNAQRHWIDYRDAELAFQGAPWSDNKGTIMQIVRSSAAVDLVRDRVLALRGTLSLIE